MMRTSSLGVQPKVVLPDGSFLKRDFHGGEAVSEVLVSAFCRAAGIHTVSYRIGEPGSCVSPNFLTPYGAGAEYIPFHAFFASEREFDVWYKRSVAQRPVDEVLQAVNWVYLSRFGIDATAYLQAILVVDTVFRNTDRHFGNFGIIRHAGGFTLPPLFDFGMSLGVGVVDGIYVQPSHVTRALRKHIKMQPFGTAVSKLGESRWFVLPTVDWDEFLSSIPRRWVDTVQVRLFIALVSRYYGVGLSPHLELITLY